MNNKKTRIAIISVVALMLILIGITYAYWLVTKTQTNSNIISSACLDITLDNEANDISLSSQYPMSDEDGMQLTPYTFTVANNCNTSIDYQVALEAIGDETSSISSSALQVALDDKADLLSNKATVATTISGAYAANRLGYGTLSATGTDGSSITHELRIWIDEDAPISEANKTYQSKISVTIGHGITVLAIKAGTLAYDAITFYGDLDIITESGLTTESHTVTRNGFLWGEEGPNYSENYYFGTEYTYSESTHKYSLSGTLIQANLEECMAGTKSCGKYTLKQTTSTASSAVLYEVTEYKEGEYADGVDMIEGIAVYGNVIKYVISGVYKTADNLGTAYYFAGSVNNNYVQFGSYAAGITLEIHDPSGEFIDVTFTEATPMYWRIVSINDDGTIKLIYDGVEKTTNGTKHVASIGTTSYGYGSSDFHPEYAGYMYIEGETKSNSAVKDFVDTWYNNHLKTKYGSYVADGNFHALQYVGTSCYEYIEEDGESFCDMDIIDTTITYFNSPVGMLTEDEINRAGEYLYMGYPYWMSYFGGDFRYSDGVYVNLADSDSEWILDDSAHVRPVITLRADVEFTGDGSFETPYVIKTN